jgi:quinone-modifying oxidoreductase, subunit QmoC
VYSIKRQIKYDADRDNTFADEVKSVPGCENLDHCIQCGTCSGICPLSIYMDLTPRRIINLVRSGFKDDALESFTIWLCAGCYACVVECPKQIGITDVMYALKQRAIQQQKYPKKFPIPVLSSEFYKMVKNKGRLSESRLVVSLLMKTNPMKFLGMQKLGMNLMKTGRFSMKSDAMERPEELGRLLEAVDAVKRGAQR